jgi:hypothetical protein
MLPTLADMNAINAASFRPSTYSSSMVLGRNAAKCFVSIIGASRLSFKVASAASCEILEGRAQGSASPVRAGRAQVFGFGLGVVIVTVFAVRGCIGNRGLGVEVGFPDVKAGWEGERLRPSRMRALVPEGSERAVVTIWGEGRAC